MEKYSASFKTYSSTKGTKYKFLDYQLQLIDAHQFLKVNEEGLNQKIYRGKK